MSPKLSRFTVIFLFSVCYVSSERHEVRLDEKYLFAWEIITENETIILEATGETRGYVGLGISPHGKMDQSEIAIGGIHLDNAKSYFGIYTGHKHKVKLDRKKKWNLLEARQNETHTYLKYERPLGNKPETEDGVFVNNYIPIKDKDIYVIWALGKSDKIKKHHGHGHIKINLINPHQDFLGYFSSKLFDFYVNA